MPNGAGLGAIGEVQADIPIVRSKGTVFSEVHTQYKVCSTHSELESPKPPRPADTQYLTIPEQSFGGGGRGLSGIPDAGTHTSSSDQGLRLTIGLFACCSRV